MTAWGKNQCLEGTIITTMADTQGNLTKMLGMSITHPGPLGKLGGPRCKRHAMYVEDGIIKALEVAEYPDDPAGDANPEVTLCENMLAKVPALSPDEERTILSKIEAEKKEDIAAAQKAIGSDNVVLLVKPSCVFSEDALEAMMSNGIKPRVFKTTPSQKRGLQALTGQTSMPSAWCKGKYIGGCNDGPEKWQGVKPMLADGSLKAMM